MRILLIEDDKMIGEGLQKALRKNGFSVNWCSDGQSGEYALQDEAYDLAILDLGLMGTNTTGSGLGLAIVKNIADRHKVKITISEGLQGKGTTFKLIFMP